MEPRKARIAGVVLVVLWGDSTLSASMASRAGPAGVKEQGKGQRTPPGTWETRRVRRERCRLASEKRSRFWKAWRESESFVVPEKLGNPSPRRPSGGKEAQ
jgi:hypothetical protein